jgi:Phosphoesterase family
MATTRRARMDRRAGLPRPTNGLLIITFDESSGDSTACCNELPGAGGGIVGAVLLSPGIAPGTVSTTGYNHYSLLASIEDVFGLPRIGDAVSANAFGPDVYTHPSGIASSTSGSNPSGGKSTVGGPKGKAGPDRVRAGTVSVGANADDQTRAHPCRQTTSQTRKPLQADHERHRQTPPRQVGQHEQNIRAQGVADERELTPLVPARWSPRGPEGVRPTPFEGMFATRRTGWENIDRHLSGRGQGRLRHGDGPDPADG